MPILSPVHFTSLLFRRALLSKMLNDIYCNLFCVSNAAERNLISAGT